MTKDSGQSEGPYAFDIMALDGEDLRQLPLSLCKTDLARLLARRPDGIFVAPYEQGEIGPDLFRAACTMGLAQLSQLASQNDNFREF
jgi:bifunctional non-homologous end joining protein LigD